MNEEQDVDGTPEGLIQIVDCRGSCSRTRWKFWLSYFNHSHHCQVARFILRSLFVLLPTTGPSLRES